MMKILVDSAVLSDIRRWHDQGVIDGVTTNPTLILKAGVFDLETHEKTIARLIEPLPLSVEVTTNDPAEMLDQARLYASWAPNIVVKIPIINQDGESCLGVIHTAEREGIAVNATALLSLGQVILATKAGASYVSIFAGRVADEGHDAPALIRAAADWLARWDSLTEIIVGSVRGVIDIQQAAIAGAHIITIPPPMLDKMLDHKYTRETVRQFNEDAQHALAVLEHT
ncbi:MAG TPA: transaldolase family protein [Aggregatilineaceae bacterium]|nr:transaldolase family protein [Aggregatilineaceae bacterium]